MREKSAAPAGYAKCRTIQVCISKNKSGSLLSESLESLKMPFTTDR